LRGVTAAPAALDIRVGARHILRHWLCSTGSAEIAFRRHVRRFP
jgi:hypothetical protein